MKFTLLILLLVVQSGPPGYSPFSSHTPMGFGSSPALQEVGLGAIFTQTAWVSDMDTWRKDSDHSQYTMVANPNTTITLTCRSGTQQPNPNESYDAPSGKRTLIWTIYGWSSISEENVFVDHFDMVDGGGQPVHDLSQVSNNTVKYPAPSPPAGPPGTP